MVEIWKVSSDENYEVSSLGNIRRVGKAKCLKMSWTGSEYQVNLSISKGGRSATKSMGLRKMVWEAFNGPVPPGKVLSFKDPKNKCSLDNIVLTTHSEAVKKRRKRNWAEIIEEFRDSGEADFYEWICKTYKPPTKKKLNG